MAQMKHTNMVQRMVRCGQVMASRISQGAEMYQSNPPVILSSCHVPINFINADLQNRQCRICDTLQNLEMTMDCKITLMVEVKKSLILTTCTQPGYFWLMNSTLVDRYCRQTSTRNTKNAPKSWERLKPCQRVNASAIAYHTEFLVNRKWINAMKAPSNSTPNSEVIVTGLKANQKMVSEVFATMNSEIPEPSPQPLLSRSSSRMTMTPAPINCAVIKNIVIRLICEGCPQAPIQMDPATSPKQKMSANTLSRALASLSSALELIFMSPIATKICPIQLAEMIGDIPNSISDPLLDAMITLAQQSGSESCDLSIPQIGI